jgi:hypothetical protein
MNFPLDARFKLLAIASQISVTDASGAVVFYARQKAFKLKEAVTVFADEAQTRPVYKVAADRVLDISAKYHIQDPGGAEVAVLQRQGMRSLWRLHFDIEVGGRPAFTIREENPWTKVLDELLGSIPILSLLTGYLFNPTYLVSRTDGPAVLRIAKQPALLEGRFKLEPTGPDTIPDAVVVAVLMMLLLERQRG